MIAVNNLVKHFDLGGGVLSKASARLTAVNGVSFQVKKGESFGVVGESGCGKTTLGRLILRLLEPNGGRILFDGRDISHLKGSGLKPYRRRMQMIFQDPYSSLDPRMKVESIITEPLRAVERQNKSARRDRAAELLTTVGLRPGDLNKYPHQFSGGQRQRIGIARALCVRPELIVADEPVSALDVSIQAQVINLLTDLKDEFQLAYVLISHDLAVVGHVCDRVAVMYLGEIVEMAPTSIFIENPGHPYTQTLLAAVPRPDPRQKRGLAAMAGEVPDPMDPPPGCAFHPRCPSAADGCRKERPELVEVEPGHWVACRRLS